MLLDGINQNISSTKAILSAAASLAASALLFRTITAELLPDQFHAYISSRFPTLSNKFSSKLTVVIDEFNALTPNQMFTSATLYLSAKISPSTRRIKAYQAEKENKLSFTMDNNEEVLDYFDNVKLKWRLLSKKQDNHNFPSKKSLRSSEIRYLELEFSKRHKDLVLYRYLPYIIKKAKEIKQERKEIKLHTVDYNGTDYWSCVNLDHPATFEKIAMDPEVKRTLMEDLDRFRSRGEYYRRVGKAWKRGYLLYGPPGTGKSSLVAAMANYLRFDLYDLDLGEVMCNSDLRRLLIGTASKSILVIEDIDCSTELQSSESLQINGADLDNKKVTLSGMLNFIDGLWSTCGDERIIVFTTNYKDRLDPALLRPGRMDVHIHMSYLTFSGFKILAANYLGVQDHPFFKDIEQLLAQGQVTPAEVAGELMKNDSVDTSLGGLINFLQAKRRPEIEEHEQLHICPGDE
ncbi:hypothetical protein Ancab_025573 [Ancistrocladus abbreviatus]